MNEQQVRPARAADRLKPVAQRNIESALARAVRSIRARALWLSRWFHLQRMRRLVIPRREFLADLKYAVDSRTGYAAGKIGRSQQHWMYYDILLKRQTDREEIRRFEKDLLFHALKQSGVFPEDIGFYREFNRFYIPHVKNLDCIGICFTAWEPELFRYYGIRSKPIGYPCQQPFLTVGHLPMFFKRADIAESEGEGNGYLEYFRNKRILLVCPFAKFLKERACKETYEAIWSKTGRKWFEPKSVEAVELPYGFEIETQKKYGTAIDLFHAVVGEIDARDFDIALIGAAGLAIPIASHIKQTGRIGIDLGGILQVVFGVYGKRYLERETWKRMYFNDQWARVPDGYRPSRMDVCDGGAYW
ncbi:MAG TPA: hypothetical protein VNN77_09325 [candidate division Zixibacteria bacterium]|nr:hypothetical protein [candidate division Zixibacteria bacterium]